MNTIKEACEIHECVYIMNNGGAVMSINYEAFGKRIAELYFPLETEMWVQKILDDELPHCSECGETMGWFDNLCKYCLQYDTATFDDNASSDAE